MVQTRYNILLPFYFFLASVFSFLVSFFLLQVFLGLLSLLWIFEAWENKKSAFDTILYAVILFGILRLISIIFSVYPSQSVTAIPKEILFYTGFFAMSFYLKVFDDKKFDWVIYVFSFSAVLVAFIGILQFIFQIVDRAQSFSSGYSTFSSYLLAVLGIYLVLIEFVKWNSKYYWIIGLGIILTGLITSLGRANIFFALIIIFIYVLRNKKILFPVILAVVLAVGLSYLSFMSNSTEVASRVQAPVQLSDRDIIWEGAEQIYKEQPVLGFGPRTFHQVFPFPERFADKGIGSWHNDFIQIYFESGIVGEAGFLFLLVTPFIIGFRLLKKLKKGKSKSITAGILLAMSGLILSALFAGFIDSPVLALVYAFLISVISRESYIFNLNAKSADANA